MKKVMGGSGSGSGDGACTVSTNCHRGDDWVQCDSDPRVSC